MPDTRRRPGSNGATKARARSWTCSPITSASSDTTAAPTRVIPSWWAMNGTPCTWFRRASSSRAAPAWSGTGSWSIPASCSRRSTASGNATSGSTRTSWSPPGARRRCRTTRPSTGASRSSIAGQRGSAIGTTRRGIGPATRTRSSIDGDSGGDLRHADRLREARDRLPAAVGPASVPRARERRRHGRPPTPRGIARLGRAAPPHVCRHDLDAHDALDAGRRACSSKRANACLLDVDHGTYLFVTSSNCSTLGIPAGTGVPSDGSIGCSAS